MAPQLAKSFLILWNFHVLSFLMFVLSLLTQTFSPVWGDDYLGIVYFVLLIWYCKETFGLKVAYCFLWLIFVFLLLYNEIFVTYWKVMIEKPWKEQYDFDCKDSVKDWVLGFYEFECWILQIQHPICTLPTPVTSSEPNQNPKTQSRPSFERL